MDVYQTEDEQVEAIKKWWRENGRAILVGVVIALLAVFGWRAWQDYERGRAEAASMQYQQLLMGLEVDPQAAMDLGRQIVGEYGNTTYAVLASLAMGKAALALEDPAGAEAHLQWALDNAGNPSLEHIARLRLARLQLSQGQSEQALNVIGSVDGGSFEAQYAELRGDILLARGDRSGAREAYSTAMAAEDLIPARRQLLQLKIDDLADAEQNS